MHLSGLTQIEVEARQKQFGFNVLPQPAFTSDLTFIWRQISSPLIYILFLAALVSSVFQQYTDALVIVVAVVINTGLGFIQERKAERSLVALRQILSPRARVIRGGIQQEINATQLVPEDIVYVTAGDKISADGEVLQAENFWVNEAILTGESEPVVKSSKFRPKASTNGRWAFGPDPPLADAVHSSQKNENLLPQTA